MNHKLHFFRKTRMQFFTLSEFQRTRNLQRKPFWISFCDLAVPVTCENCWSMRVFNEKPKFLVTLADGERPPIAG